MLTPDRAMSWPLACIVAGVDLGQRLPVRGGLTLEDVPAEQAQDFADRNSLSIEQGDCLPSEATETDTTTSTSVAGKVTTTNTHKTINPDGTVTTTVTTTKPDGTKDVQVSTEPYTAPRPASVLLRLTLDNGAEFGLIRPLTKLRVGDTVTVIENYTDRHTVRAWANAIVHSPPKWTFKHHAEGTEFYVLSMEFIVIGAAP